MGKIYKLCDLVETRFLYVTIGVDVKYVLNCCERLKTDTTFNPNAGNQLQAELFQSVKNGEEPTFDLATCNITSDITKIIFEWQDKGWHFIDTADAARNSILVENDRRLREKPEEIIGMPVYKLSSPAAQYIGALRTDAVYRYYENNDIYRSLVIMTALLRPNVQFEMDNVMAKVLDVVSAALPTSLLKQYDEFYYHTNEGVEILRAENGYVNTQRMGRVNIDTASYGGYLVPTVFGKEVLYKEPGWDTVFKNALNYLNRAKELRPKTLKEVLVGDEK